MGLIVFHALSDFLFFVLVFPPSLFFFFFFFNDTATTEIYTLSLHDALPISRIRPPSPGWRACLLRPDPFTSTMSTQRLQQQDRSEEHTSELQSPCNLVCRLLLEKKKKKPSPRSYPR